MLKSEVERNLYQLEVTAKIREALKSIPGPIVIHKFVNGKINIYCVTNTGGLYLFDRLHEGHDDIINEILLYGEYLLDQKLKEGRRRKRKGLELVKK